MAFSVSQFNSIINQTGLAQNNLFLIRVTLPASLTFLYEKLGTNVLTFLCRSADLPEIAVQTTAFKPRGFGPSEQRPTGIEYPNLPLVFMVDSDFGVLKFYQRWMQDIVNYNVQDGYLATSAKQQLPYEFGYRDDYACTVEVIVYSGASEDKFTTYKFGNAYPVSIGNITTAWENSAEIMTLPIQFTYDELHVDGIDRGFITDLLGGINGPVNFLQSLGVFGDKIQSVSLPRGIQDAINSVNNVNRVIDMLD